METKKMDMMQESITRIKFGMTPTEAQDQGICLKCKQLVLTQEINEQQIAEYQNSGFCPTCSDSVALV